MAVAVGSLVGGPLGQVIQSGAGFGELSVSLINVFSLANKLGLTTRQPNDDPTYRTVGSGLGAIL